MKNKNKTVWSNRFTKGNSRSFQRIGSSINIDKRLYKEDIFASIIHAQMLIKQKIIPKKDGIKIINGLKKIEKEINIPVQGGLDPKVLLTDKENIKKEATKYLDIFKNHPYIFNLGHGVLPETNPEMMEYLVKTVKDY